MKYLELKERHQQEINAFPMSFAFSDNQFKEGMAKLGLDPTETDKIYKFGSTGGFYRREDSKALWDMLDRHKKEFKAATDADTTGEGFILDMFTYELANHEYIITGSVGDTLDALGLTIEEVNASPALFHGLVRAKIAQRES